MFRWIVGKYGDLIPLLAFFLVLGAVYAYDREKSGEQVAAARERENIAERRASFLADRIGDAINIRLGAMSTGELTFTTVEDSVSRRTLNAALDTITSRFPGLAAISAVYPNGYISRGADAALGREAMDLQKDSAVHNAFMRAKLTKQPAATGTVATPRGRRVVVFNPVTRNGELMGYLAAELDPAQIYRSVVSDTEVNDSLTAGGFPTYHAVSGPNGGIIASQPGLPTYWPSVTKPVSVADTKWKVVLAYAPIETKVYKTERGARWAIGVMAALMFAFFFFVLRRTIARQREEIALRMAAEEASRASAAEARERAREARELASQLEAAQRASQRLSTSLNPDLFRGRRVTQPCLQS